MNLSLSLSHSVLFSLLVLPFIEPNFYVMIQGPTEKTSKRSCSHKTPWISLSISLPVHVQVPLLLLPPLPLPNHIGPGLAEPHGAHSLGPALHIHEPPLHLPHSVPVMRKQSPCFFPSCIHRTLEHCWGSHRTGNPLDLPTCSTRISTNLEFHSYPTFLLSPSLFCPTQKTLWSGQVF